jgi:Sporulation and spore germination
MRAHMRRLSDRAARVRAGTLVLLAAIAALAACGIPTDAGPRDIAPVEGSAPNGQPSAPNQPGTPSSKVYFLATGKTSSDEHLQPAARAVAPAPAELLQQLLDGLTKEEQAKRWRTAIPSGTRLLSTHLVGGGVLAVNLSEQFFKTAGEAQFKAVAQIVFTATEAQGVTAVSIAIDGVEREWPREDGSLTEVLTPFAYPGLDPTSQPDLPPIPSPTPPTTPGATSPTTRPAATTTGATTTAPLSAG